MMEVVGTRLTCCGLRQLQHSEELRELQSEVWTLGILWDFLKSLRRVEGVFIFCISCMDMSHMHGVIYGCCCGFSISFNDWQEVYSIDQGTIRQPTCCFAGSWRCLPQKIRVWAVLGCCAVTTETGARRIPKGWEAHGRSFSMSKTCINLFIIPWSKQNLSMCCKLAVDHSPWILFDPDNFARFGHFETNVLCGQIQRPWRRRGSGSERSVREETPAW